jgi:hypothetical protein
VISPRAQPRCAAWRDLRAVVGALAFVANLAMAQAEKAPEPVIQIEDVERFYRVYDAAGGRPTAEQLQRDYLDPGSEGLHQLAKVRSVTGAKIAEALARNPALYSDARRCAAVLPKVQQRLRAALHTLGRLYPQARFPPVTIAIGRGKPVGVGSPATGVQIGLEALCATTYLNPNVEDRFVYVIAHEFVHVQQAADLTDGKNLTVLEASLMEGVAEFTAELIAGKVAYSQLAAMTRGREKAIETAFLDDSQKTDHSDWLNNGTPEKPGDLGYWVGYRIAKSYYRHASDKRVALREMLEMTDAKAFLARSGWYPGIRLP